MDFDFYQEAASRTDQFQEKKVKKDEGLMIPLLGIAGETGTLLAEFKKKIRDKESYEGFKEKAEEELGDILWYLSNIASRLELSLSEIASKNLQKTNERWPVDGDALDMFLFFDEGSPPREQLPRVIEIRIFEIEKGKRAHMQVYPDGNMGRSRSRFEVCFRVRRTSPENARLSQTRIFVPARRPTGNVLS